MPPSRARAMASRASVTVSMAADRTGMLSRMPGASATLRSTWSGITADRPGTNSTSSKVKASFMGLVQEHRFAEHVGDLGPVLLDVVHLVHVYPLGARDDPVERDVGIDAVAQGHHPPRPPPATRSIASNP